MLCAMRILSPSFSMIMAAFLAFNVHATPDKISDNIEALPSDKGLLLTQIDQVRQNVGFKASSLVASAMGLVGVPYRRGGSTAESGFDCSGFVRSVYQNSLGLLLPRKAEEQASATQLIRRKDLKPGDLVFFNTMRQAFSHVGIYIGEGKFIHSPKPGSRVRIDSMDMDYWQGRFNGARRVPAIPPATTPLAAGTSFDMTASLLDMASPLESLEPLETAMSSTSSTSFQATGPIVIPASNHGVRILKSKAHDKPSKPSKRTEKTKKQEAKLKKHAQVSHPSKSPSSRAKKRAKA